MASSSQNTIQAMNAAIDKECPICQCEMIIPFSVPSCGHTFCFTCLKGVSMANIGCPICRGPIDDQIFKKPSQNIDLKQEIPASPTAPAGNPNKTLDRDVKVEIDEDVKPNVEELNAAIEKEQPEKMFWLYHGRHQGWWRFDPRNEKDIEEAFVAGMPVTEVTIVGKPYIIDFTKMNQYPKNRADSARDVKRVSSSEFDTYNVKGLAGVFVSSH